MRLVNNRHESFLAHPKRHPARLFYKLGAKRDGTLVALQATVHMDTGAYASYGTAVGGLLTEMVPGAYRIPHVRVETLVVYTNSLFSGAMRGFGSPQALRHESLIDMLAGELAWTRSEPGRNMLRPAIASSPGSAQRHGEQPARHPRFTPRQARARLSASRAAGKVAGVGCARRCEHGPGYRAPTTRQRWSGAGTAPARDTCAPDWGRVGDAAEQIAAGRWHPLCGRAGAGHRHGLSLMAA